MKEDISQLVEQNLENINLENPDYAVKEIQGGENNRIFEISSENRRLIARTSNKVSEDRIRHEAGILELLEKEEVENVPRKIFLEDSDLAGQPVLIETSVGTRDIEFSEMSREELRDFAEQLARIHSITPDSYNRKFGKNEPKEASMEKEMGSNFEKYSRQPYRNYMEMADAVDPRVKDMFRRQKSIYGKLTEVNGKLPWRMVHGDPADNIRTDGRKVFIIDWEFCRPGVPFFELIYTFRHNDVDREERQQFLQYYRTFRDTSEIAEQNADLWEKFLAFNDMIWAAERKEKEKRAGGDVSEYEDLFEERMKELEKLHR